MRDATSKRANRLDLLRVPHVLLLLTQPLPVERLRRDVLQGQQESCAQRAHRDAPPACRARPFVFELGGPARGDNRENAFEQSRIGAQHIAQPRAHRGTAAGLQHFPRHRIHLHDDRVLRARRGLQHQQAVWRAFEYTAIAFLARPQRRRLTHDLAAQTPLPHHRPQGHDKCEKEAGGHGQQHLLQCVADRLHMTEPLPIKRVESPRAHQHREAFIDQGQQFPIAVPHGDAIAHIVTLHRGIERADVLETEIVCSRQRGQPRGQRGVGLAFRNHPQRLLHRFRIDHRLVQARLPQQHFPHAAAVHRHLLAPQVREGPDARVILPHDDRTAHRQVGHREIRLLLPLRELRVTLLDVDLPFAKRLVDVLGDADDPLELERHHFLDLVDQLVGESRDLPVFIPVGKRIIVAQRAHPHRPRLLRRVQADRNEQRQQHSRHDPAG